nr:hypothetical protein Iba_scaffold52934CG0010 [Ipomoea batatas]
MPPAAVSTTLRRSDWGEGLRRASTPPQAHHAAIASGRGPPLLPLSRGEEVAGHAPVAAESSHGRVRSPPSSPGTIAHTSLPSAAGFVADGGAGRMIHKAYSRCLLMLHVGEIGGR